MKDVNALMAACSAIEADPALQPVRDAAGRVVETHCNFGAERVAEAMGCFELSGLMADGQYAAMAENASGLWRQVSSEDATAHALEGGLAFACASSAMLGEAHGHIAAVYPVPGQYSGSLGKVVPIVANIGMTDQLERESMAFPVARGEPAYFAWEG